MLLQSTPLRSMHHHCKVRGRQRSNLFGTCNQRWLTQSHQFVGGAQQCNPFAEVPGFCLDTCELLIIRFKLWVLGWLLFRGWRPSPSVIVGRPGCSRCTCMHIAVQIRGARCQC